MLTLSALIVLGGLGFLVWDDVLRVRKTRRLSVYTKLVLIVTGILLLGGTVGFCLLEWDNPRTLGALPWPSRILAAFFQSVTLRTAGFAGIDQGSLSSAGKGLSLFLMIIGGSLGAQAVNEAVRAALPELLPHFRIMHLCGKGKMDASLEGTEGYVQYEYIKEELPDLFALADVVISRAGANAICELLALKKPNLLIPLSKNASRGDQILNARSFEKQGFSVVLEEEEVTTETLTAAVLKLYDERAKYVSAMAESKTADAIEIITGLIESLAKKS
jgi:UDP-N-acetylglucosamine:LPS N-acetylglucosamine transferase